MATDLSGQNVLPATAKETIGTSYVTLTVPKTAQRVDVYFETNDGYFSYDSGTPSEDCPVPADTWFVLWEKPEKYSQADYTVQVKTALAGTTVFYRVV